MAARPVHPRAPGPLPPSGWAVFAVLLAVSAAAAIFAALHDHFPAEPDLVRTAQDVGGWYEPIADFTNDWLHYYIIPVVWFLTVAAFAWLRRFDLAALFALAAAAPPLNGLLKDIVGRPRPAGDFDILEFPDTMAYPSGHVMTAVAFLGMWIVVAGALLPPRWAWTLRAAAAVLIVLTSFSRVWVAAHWPSDTVGALVAGAAYLMLLRALWPWLHRVLPSKPLPH